MIRLDDRVMVMNNKEMIGFASVVDICDNIKKLNVYFKKNHPLLQKYRFALYNNEVVYIVDFDNNLGQGGYLQKHLKKVN